MIEVHFYRVAGLGRNATDGGAIFDDKTSAALRAAGAEVREISVHRRRAFRLPAWAGRIKHECFSGPPAGGGAKVVLSHEATFDLALLLKVDALIVHNYFLNFVFPGRGDLEFYYRAGAKRYYSRTFDRAKCIFFLSHRERAIAEEEFPHIRDRTIVVPPPAAPATLTARRNDLVHVSGSDGWLPKRLSSLTDGECANFSRAGFEIGDFGQKPAPAFGLINDRFTVGFKLKLMQMIHCRDIIASRAEIGAEMSAIAPGYPFWRQVESIGEALNYFRDTRDRITADEIDGQFEAAAGSWQLPTWPRHGRVILDALSSL